MNAAPVERQSSRSPALLRGSGFTLIELLVVVAIVGLLVGILVPSLSKARKVAKQTREMATSQQLMSAYHLYANDFRGNLMPGYASVGMTSATPTPGTPTLRVTDDKGEPLYGQEARRYPWRIAPYMNYNFFGLYDDAVVLERYQSRADYIYVVSLSPSMGINADFVGGKGEPGLGFNTQALARWGKFYITRADEARRPDQLIVFASARGVDPDGGTVNGFHMVDSPRFLTSRWSPEAFDPLQPPSTTGGVDPRWSGSAAVAMFDGHTTTMKLDELRDMRKWCTRATSADWNLP